MRLNQELRSPAMIKRFNTMLITAYIILFSGITTIAIRFYNDHKNLQLPSGYIELTLDKKKYQVGDTVNFTVTNNFPVTVFVANNCPGEPFDVYKWVNNIWVRVHDHVSNIGSLCYKQPRNVPIPAQGSVTYDFSDWKKLFAYPGVYRIVMSIDNYSELPYQDFVVLEPAPVITPTPASTPQYTTPKLPTSPTYQIFYDD